MWRIYYRILRSTHRFCRQKAISSYFATFFTINRIFCDYLIVFCGICDKTSFKFIVCCDYLRLSQIISVYVVGVFAKTRYFSDYIIACCGFFDKANDYLIVFFDVFCKTSGKKLVFYDTLQPVSYTHLTLPTIYSV